MSSAAELFFKVGGDNSFVRSFATDQYDPLGENYICDHCDPLLRKWITPLLILPSAPKLHE